jgi:L-idonate 5-dehydrogenase
MMQAAVLHGAKDLRVESRSIPELDSGQVLIRVRRAGICGSDLHYFSHGYCGVFVPTEPFVLGHEVIGEVVAASADVRVPTVGSRVVIDPSRHCGCCDFCRSGRANLCPKTGMLGSASTTPPTDGAFAEFVVVHADQCHLAPPELDDGLGAIIEPVSVALHAVRRSGNVSGRTVLVLGAGPIGLLVALTAQVFGALPVLVSDVVPARRQKALELGLDGVLDPDSASSQQQAKKFGGFEIVFEASGSPRALRQAFELVRAGGIIVQIGTVGTQDVPLPANQLMVREIQYLGSFRYGYVFGEAIRLVASGRLRAQSLISEVLPLSSITQAMSIALAKDNALKVQVQLETSSS